MENEVIHVYYLSKEFHAAVNNYLVIRFNIQRATKRNPALYTVANRVEARDAMLATWKKLKRSMRYAIEYKQL